MVVPRRVPAHSCRTVQYAFVDEWRVDLLETLVGFNQIWLVANPLVSYFALDPCLNLIRSVDRMHRSPFFWHLVHIDWL